MLLSIIVPVFNPNIERFKRCINSLKEKDLFEDVELIIVDDASTDKSFLDCLVDVPHTYIRNEENLGPGLARQVGLDASSANYVTFVDQDDEFYGSYILKTVLEEEKEIPILLRTSQIVCDPDDNRKRIWDGSTVHGMIFNRETLNKYGIRFSDRFKTNEDLFFMSRIGAVSFHEKIPIFEDSGETYTWYLWEGSTSHKDGALTYFIENFDEYLGVQKEILTFVKEKWGITPYLIQRAHMLVSDLYCITMRFPELRTACSEAIHTIVYSTIESDVYNVLTVLAEHPDLYFESFTETVQRHGYFIPSETIKDFLINYERGAA